MPLSESWLKAAHNKPREKGVEKADRDGLSVRVTPRGKIVFQMRYRYQGKPARLDIGSYPGVTLKLAREEAIKRRAQLEQGHDPRVSKRLEKQAIAEAHSNESLIRLWYETHCQHNKANHREILRSLEIHVFPEVGDLPADQTSIHAWIELLEKVTKKSPSIADRVLTNVKQAHKWGHRRRLLTEQPLNGITGKADLNITKNMDKGRALDDDEIRLVWLGTDLSHMARRSKLFLKLCLMYGCRPGELRGAEISEFDFEAGVWTIPPNRHKTGRKTDRPLIRPVIDEFRPMLEEAIALSHSTTLLFTNEGSGSPLGSRAVLCYPYSVMRAIKRHYKTEMDHFSLYDLRKTARTNWSTLTEPHVSEMMLGHKLPGVWQVYDRHNYVDEQAAAYRAWWERLGEIIGD